MQIVSSTPYLKVTMFFQSIYEMIPNSFFSKFRYFLDCLHLNDIL